MAHLSRPPPPGYKAASVEAVLRADRELVDKRSLTKFRSELRARPKIGDLARLIWLWNSCTCSAFSGFPFATTTSMDRTGGGVLKRKAENDEE